MPRNNARIISCQQNKHVLRGLARRKSGFFTMSVRVQDASVILLYANRSLLSGVVCCRANTCTHAHTVNPAPAPPSTTALIAVPYSGFRHSPEMKICKAGKAGEGWGQVRCAGGLKVRNATTDCFHHLNAPFRTIRSWPLDTRRTGLEETRTRGRYSTAKAKARSKVGQRPKLNSIPPPESAQRCTYITSHHLRA